MTHIQNLLLKSLRYEPTFDGNMEPVYKYLENMSDREIAEKATGIPVQRAVELAQDASDWDGWMMLCRDEQLMLCRDEQLFGEAQ
jgi:hypothetical protein